jgi:BASS family bile acid:Na+ symporter
MHKALAFFPLGAIAISIFSIYQPEWMATWKAAIVPLLGIVMFGMGMTLTLSDFTRVLRQPKLIGLGITMQYGLMPMIAWLLSQILNLPLMMTAGMVLVGTCPGGTASNVICYLGRGDVALSITLTTVSTLLAVFLTPFMAWVYIGQSVPVPVVNMIIDIVKIIIVPVSLGVLTNLYFGHRLTVIKKIFPMISVTAIIIIIGIIVARNQPQLPELAIPIIIAVILHNSFGLCSGYYVGKLMGYDPTIRRTLAIEVGMQNSGLAVALADKYFTVAAALPGAFFSIWHNVTGSFLAWYWSRAMQVKPID